MMMVVDFEGVGYDVKLIGTSENYMMIQMGKIVETWLIHQPSSTPSYSFIFC